MWILMDNVVMDVGVRELKARLSHYLDLAQGGQDVVVTEHGRPVARIVGIRLELPAHLASMAQRGELQPARRTRAALGALAPPVAAGSLVDVLLEERQREYDRVP